MTAFPEPELREFAACTPVKVLREKLHAAIEAHAEIRERCLVAEMQIGQAKLALSKVDHAA